MTKHKLQKTIQYKNLCYVGKSLSTWGLPTFIEHVKNCKQCNKHNMKKINWQAVWIIIKNILIALLTANALEQRL